MTFHALIMLGIASTVPASAFKLLLASYGPGTGQAGAVQILAHNEYSASLNVVQTSQQCGALPTWLDMSMGTNRITCTDESEPGSLNMLSIQPNGTIARLSSAPTLNGPVSSIYFNNNSAVAVAHVGWPLGHRKLKEALTENSIKLLPSLLTNWTTKVDIRSYKTSQSTPHQAQDRPFREFINQFVTPRGSFWSFPTLVQTASMYIA